MDFMQTILGKVISVMRCEYAQQRENNESRPQLGYIVDSEKYPQEGLQMQEWAEIMD